MNPNVCCCFPLHFVASGASWDCPLTSFVVIDLSSCFPLFIYYWNFCWGNPDSPELLGPVMWTTQVRNLNTTCQNRTFLFTQTLNMISQSNLAFWKANKTEAEEYLCGSIIFISFSHYWYWLYAFIKFNSSFHLNKLTISFSVCIITCPGSYTDSES